MAGGGDARHGMAAFADTATALRPRRSTTGRAFTVDLVSMVRADIGAATGATVIGAMAIGDAAGKAAT